MITNNRLKLPSRIFLCLDLSMKGVGMAPIEANVLRCRRMNKSLQAIAQHFTPMVVLDTVKNL